MAPALPASARLVVERGLSEATLRAASGLPSLYVLPSPPKKGSKIEESGDTVRLRFAHGWPWQRSAEQFTLNADVAWDIEVRGGMSSVHCELETLKLTSFSVLGGMSNVDIALGRPIGSAVFRLTGGASHFVFRRPKEVAVRLAIRGGASQVALDDYFFGAVGGKLRMESPGYAESTERYDIEILGGVSHLKIGSL